jgi:hypothetical protein
MTSSNDIRSALAGLLDTEPKRFTLDVVIVNPSQQGSWIAGTDLAGVRVLGNGAPTAADALRNLFDKLTASRGYREDAEIQVALEMTMAGKDAADLFAQTSTGSRAIEPGRESETPAGRVERLKREARIAELELDDVPATE